MSCLPIHLNTMDSSNVIITTLKKLVSHSWHKPFFLFNFGLMPSWLLRTLSTACPLLHYLFTLLLQNYLVPPWISQSWEFLGAFVILGWSHTLNINLNQGQNHVFFLVTQRIKVPTIALILPRNIFTYLNMLIFLKMSFLIICLTKT